MFSSKDKSTEEKKDALAREEAKVEAGSDAKATDGKSGASKTASPTKTVPAPDVDVPADLTKKDDKPKRPPRKDGEKETAENEIMVAAKGKIKSYLGYAFRILNKTGYRQLIIKATGNAIVKALILVELIKKKVGEIHNYDLHQSNKIHSMEIVT
jgi:DNA-binding protein